MNREVHVRFWESAGLRCPAPLTYQQAFGEAIDCQPNPKSNPAYRTSFKRIAVALSAWQSSSDVNSFSSKRDQALAADSDHKFPLEGFTNEENQGHDLFY